MSKGNTHENEYLLHVFQNAAMPGIGDAAGLLPSAVAGSLFVALHSSDPGEAGTQATGEVSYTGYARVAVARSAAGWTVTGNLVENAAAITFGQRTNVGSVIATHFSVGDAVSGATKLRYKGPLGTVVQGPFTANDLVGDTLVIPGHTFAVDERCAFFPAFGSALPGGIVEGTLYWVKTVSGESITISATQGGVTLDITSVGDGVAYEATTLDISLNVTPQFNAGQLDITED